MIIYVYYSLFSLFPYGRVKDFLDLTLLLRTSLRLRCFCFYWAPISLLLIRNCGFASIYCCRLSIGCFREDLFSPIFVSVIILPISKAEGPQKKVGFSCLHWLYFIEGFDHYLLAYLKMRLYVLIQDRYLQTKLQCDIGHHRIELNRLMTPQLKICPKSWELKSR